MDIETCFSSAPELQHHPAKKIEALEHISSAVTECWPLGMTNPITCAYFDMDDSPVIQVDLGNGMLTSDFSGHDPTLTIDYQFVVAVAPNVGFVVIFLTI